MVEHYNQHGNLDDFNERLPMSPNMNRRNMGQQREGLTQTQINRLSSERLSLKESNLLKEESCSICLGSFTEEEQVRRLPVCSHVFHQECIDAWLERKRECPNCKNTI